MEEGKKKRKESKYPPGKKNVEKYKPKGNTPRKPKKPKEKDPSKYDPVTGKRIKKPPPPKNKEYLCYVGECSLRFQRWGLAIEHMENVHNLKNPKLKRSMRYISGPRAEKQKIQLVEEENNRKIQEEKRLVREKRKLTILGNQMGMEPIEGRDIWDILPDFVDFVEEIPYVPQPKIQKVRLSTILVDKTFDLEKYSKKYRIYIKIEQIEDNFKFVIK